MFAETALVGWYINDTAENLHKEGVELSLTKSGLTSSATQVYYNTSVSPANYIDPENSSYNADAISTIDKEWVSSGSGEEKLEQIITQKYLADYPNGFESRGEWKRAGYPKMFGIPFDLSNKGSQNISSLGEGYGVRRYLFPQKGFELNRKNVTAA